MVKSYAHSAYDQYGKKLMYSVTGSVVESFDDTRFQKGDFHFQQVSIERADGSKIYTFIKL